MPLLNASRRILLVGRPNVGKSVLFHALTGRYAVVSNYAGTTLDLRRARVEDGAREVCDTPGLFSLSARTEDEGITRDEILREAAGCLVHVGSARDLAGSLSLFLELARLRLPMALALNMLDEAEAKGYRLDAPGLSRLLGVDVVPCVAVRGWGVDALKAALDGAPRIPALPPLPADITRAVSALEERLPEGARRWALLALTCDDATRRRLVDFGHLSGADLGEVEKARRRFSRNPAFLYQNCARAWAEELAARVQSRGGASSSARALEALGRWSLHPVFGTFLALGVLWGLYRFVGVFGAGSAVDFLEERVFGAWLTPAVTSLVQRLLPWPLLQDALVGPYGVFSMALTYALALILPIVTTFFLAFSFLEDSGYLPRFSVVTDRLFRLIGLNGKAVLPMLLGLGCGTMAIVTTRILETRRERLLVSFLLALTVPCSAQLGVILGMAGGASPAVLGTWLGVVAFTLIAVGWTAARVMPGAAAAFVIDIPPLRLPQPGNVARKVTLRLRWYLAEVVPLFVYGTLALFALERLGALAVLERASAPLVQGLLGLPREATSAFLLGFLRRDYGSAGLFQLHRDGLLDPRQVAVSLVCITLFMPCFAQFLITLREHGWKTTAVISSFVFAYALAVAAGVSRLWGG